MQGEIRSPLSLKPLKESLKLKPPEDSGIGSGSLPTSIFGREMGEVKMEAESQAAWMEFVKTYNFGHLDEYKRQREIEEERKIEEERGFEQKETKTMIRGESFKSLQDSLVMLKNSSDASTKRSST
ncbi:uncharacterized protein LOC131257024 isoform X2 [Magnolia sinica]|uniref:uncharacterized protein LOC131257024 isoform X2 n=1 Tax=Magnolia sinica TaxID=86752 RepID=UPI002657AB8E|nr:uncharacterized protein LOC131257024 isoform X2 [Magnolia sinica]